jgi:hypothetical protein
MVMAKNCFAQQMLQNKEKAYSNGVWDGMRMGFNIVAIALNHKFGFGETRLSRLEAKVQDLVDEIVDTADPVVTKVHIETALKQIRGDAWVDD